MPSPFPGMDPFLEGYLWPDFHHGLATEIRRRLTPLLRPRYVARVEVYLVEDGSPEAEVGILYPDVEVLERKSGRDSSGTAGVSGPWPPSSSECSPSSLEAPLTVPLLESAEVRVAFVEVRDAARNELVTSIEILSPVNKRAPGLDRYLQRRDRLMRSGVHLLELDFLRRGTRPLAHRAHLPSSDYLVALTRSGARVVDLWPVSMRDGLPDVPVPLRLGDPDVALELAPSFRTVYDEAAYDLSVDYRSAPPPPPLSPEDASWLRGILRPAGM